MIAEIPPSATRAPFRRKPWSPSIPISPAKSCWSPVAHPASGLSVPDAKKPDSRATSARCALLFGLWDCKQRVLQGISHSCGFGAVFGDKLSGPQEKSSGVRQQVSREGVAEDCRRAFDHMTLRAAVCRPFPPFNRNGSVHVFCHDWRYSMRTRSTRRWGAKSLG